DLGVPFGETSLSQHTALFDRLCRAPTTQPFCRRLIELVCSGYYTTRQGHAAIGDVGNVGLTIFPEPPHDVVRDLEAALRELPQGLEAPPALAFGAASAFHTFKNIQISDKFWSEGVAIADINRDGHIDVISGPYWYEGPDFRKRHEIFPAT